MADRIECPMCEKDVQLKNDGTIRSHRIGGSRCWVSGMTLDDAREVAVRTTYAESEHVAAEVVENPQPRPEGAEPGQAVELADRPASVLEAATAAAMAMPGVPGMDEFLSLAMQARMLSMSGAAPAHIRNHPHIAFHVAMIGRDLGISPTAAIQLIDVIGKADDPNPQLSLSPELLNGQIRRLGLGSIRPITRTGLLCVAGAYGPDGELLGESEFSWGDAVIAGLADDRCEPTRHWVANQQQCRCRRGYRTYPKRMLWWRAAGFAAQDYFPEAGLGLYSPEALGAIVDETGRPIDPTQVELPEGYRPHGNGQARAVPAEDIADGGDLWVLQARIAALPAAQKAELRTRWAETPRLQVDGARRDDGGPVLIPANRLPVSAMRLVRSFVSGLESQARRTDDGYDPDEATRLVLTHCAMVLAAFLTRTATDTPPAAQSPQETTPPPQDPEPARGAQESTQAGPVGREVIETVEIPDDIRAMVDAATVEEVETELAEMGIVYDGMSTPEKRRALMLAEMRAQAARGG